VQACHPRPYQPPSGWARPGRKCQNENVAAFPMRRQTWRSKSARSAEPSSG
jgi:hypothetical protein